MYKELKQGPSKLYCNIEKNIEFLVVKKSNINIMIIYCFFTHFSKIIFTDKMHHRLNKDVYR